MIESVFDYVVFCGAGGHGHQKALISETKKLVKMHYKLFHVLLYDIFVHYFGMISRQFGMRILFTFLTEKKNYF